MEVQEWEVRELEVQEWEVRELGEQVWRRFGIRTCHWTVPCPSHRRNKKKNQQESTEKKNTFGTSKRRIHQSCIVHKSIVCNLIDRCDPGSNRSSRRNETHHQHICIRQGTHCTGCLKGIVLLGIAWEERVLAQGLVQVLALVLVQTG